MKENLNTMNTMKAKECSNDKLIAKAVGLLTALADNRKALEELPLAVRVEIGDKYADLLEEVKRITNVKNAGKK